MRHSTFIEVNLGYLKENVSKIRSMTSAQLIPMVKANAYGNGLVPVSRFLVEECEAKKLGCATLGEALHLFQEIPKLKAEVIVFSDTEILNPELRRAYSEFNITPVLHQISEIETVLKDPELKNMPLVVKINSGMNRLGLGLDELSQIAPKLKARGVKHLLTHFACSYYVLKEGDKNHRQLEEFRKARQILSDAGVAVEETSLSNSGAIEQRLGVNETYIRPGLMLYGPPSVEPRMWDGHQISRFVSKIIKTFAVKKGTPVGYGINVAGEDGFIAVVAVGYGDWCLTTASGAEIMINGYKGKIFARVNMDMMFIIFPMDVAGKLKAEESVEMWNHDNRVITELATQMKTIPYQLMCGVSSRIPRIYKGS